MTNVVRSALFPIVLASVVFATYINSLDNSFHFDDNHSIVENHHLRTLQNVPQFFLDSNTFSNESTMGMYRPLLQVTFALNYAWGRYEVGGYRIVNLLVHIFCAWLVFVIVTFYTGSRDTGIAVSLLFSLHPINSQVVNYISSRSESLSSMGVLCALYLTLREMPWRGAIPYGLALLVKSIAVVTLPLLVILKGFCRKRDRRWKHFVPFVMVAGVYLGIIISDGFLIKSLDQEVRSLGDQVFTQLKATVFYLQLLIMPVCLNVEHSFVISRKVSETAVFMSLCFLSSLVYAVWSLPRFLAIVPLGIAWFLLSISLTFIFPLSVVVNEHRVYLASIGLLLSIVGVLNLGRDSLTVKSMLFVALITFTAMSFQRNAIWFNEYTLWHDAALKSPGMFRAQSNYGLALYHQNKPDIAKEVLTGALELNPSDAKAWNNYGLVQEDLADFAAAEEAFKIAVRLQPRFSGGHANLGRHYLGIGNLSNAEYHLEQAIELNPHNIEARVNRGRLFEQLGDYQRGEIQYRKALKLDREYPPALNNLALVLERRGDIVGAEELLKQAVKFNPLHSESRANLLLLQLEDQGYSRREVYEQVLEQVTDQPLLWKVLGDLRARDAEWEPAIQAYNTSLELAPYLKGVKASLADAYRSNGNVAAAIAMYQEAIKESPGNIGLLSDLASAYSDIGRFEEAIKVTKKALKMVPSDPRNRDNLELLKQLLKRHREQIDN